MFSGHHSEETKKKISNRFIGINNPNYGKKLSDEQKRKISETKKARWSSLPESSKMRMSRKGSKLSEEHKSKISKYLADRNRMEKVRIYCKGCGKEILLLPCRAKAKTFCSHQCYTKWNIGLNNPSKRPDLREYQRQRAIQQWRDGGIPQNRKPTKPEIKLQLILDDLYPSEFRYVGDGQIRINGKNPDFINVNGRKQIIELFGDYWHKDQNPQERIDCFTPYGYKTLVVWEKELKDERALKNKLFQFTGEVY